MKVFCDYHHAGLYHSIQMLFEKRLGFDLYRPIGLEWAEKGIWQYSDQLATQRQYLDLVGFEYDLSGFYRTFENSEGVSHKAVTFDQFQNMDFDIILASCSQHELPFAYLQKKFKPNAKFVRLAGNSLEPMDWSLTQNLIDTTDLYPAGPGVNRVVIHQEFSLDTFYYALPTTYNKIKTYVNCFDESPHYQEYLRWRELLSDYEWKEHGHHGADGFICPVQKLADSMRDSTYIMHIKSHGEGYGHIVHNAFAVGRPLITVLKYYEGKLAYSLFEDGVTCVDIGDKNEQDSVSKIKYFADPERLKKLSENANRRFNELVNFDQDEQKFRQFLSRLL